MPRNEEQTHHHDLHEHDDHHWCPRLDRRAAVRLLSMTTLAAVSGCGSSGTATTATSTGTTATTTSLTSSATSAETGVKLTFTATVSPSATGTITFYEGATAIGTGTLSSGVATLTTSFTAAGKQVLTAVYAGSTTYATSTSAAITVTITAATTASCSSATLEGEEGPYFVDDSASGYFRSNILSNIDGSGTQTGIPLALTVYIFDSENSCTPMQNVQVDIWHCNAAGIYSAESVESTTGQSWLRGYQLTDANGLVEFQTIIPGWYQGRTTHIHMRLRSTYDQTDNSGSNTMQVFFDQTLVDTLATSVAPYSSEGTNNTTNAVDRVYSEQEKGTTLLTLTGSDTAGYTATANVYLPITGS